MKDYMIGAMLALCLCLLFTCINLVNSVRHHHCDETEFQFTVTDSTMSVYNGSTYVGTVKVQGQLDSLLVDYNQ